MPNAQQQLSRLTRPAAAIIMLVLLGTSATPQAHAAININITQVGFPAINGTGTNANVIRKSAWTPIIVDLDLIDETAFDGTLRVAQFDGDGDQYFDRVDIHLRAETGGAQRVWLYTLVNPNRNEGQVFVELLGPQGEMVEFISAGERVLAAGPVDNNQPVQIDDNAMLVLSVTAGALGHVKALATSDDTTSYFRDIYVAHLGPSELPELWIGLEAIDAVVWDDADPDDLTPRQTDALIHWVRQGGVLLMAASRSAAAVKLSKRLDRILPIDIGEVAPVDNLPSVRQELLTRPVIVEGTDSSRVPAQRTSNDLWFEEPFPTPVPISRCTLRPGATRIAPLDEDEPLSVARRREGRGHVIFFAVTIGDLLSGGGGARLLFEKLFWINQRHNPDEYGVDAVSLFSEVVGAVAFSTSSGIYLLAASIFSIAYVVAATGGVWWFLGKRGRRIHSWSVFGIVALVAAFLSVTGVRAFQGFGDRVHQISVVDLAAGDSFGYASIFFGLKTATDAKLDVWLPQDPSRDIEPADSHTFLRPLPSGQDLFEESTSFTDPIAYGLSPSVGAVEGARFRATLKRFEGRWDGAIGGTVTGNLTSIRRVFSDESYVTNELGIDLTNCWLIHSTKDMENDYDDVARGFRSDNYVFAFPIGNLKKDGGKVFVADRCYKPTADETLNTFLLRSMLSRAQTTWSRAFRSVLSNIGLGETVAAAGTLADVQKAMLLATTVGEMDPGSLKSVTSQVTGINQTWSRDRLRWLDLRNQFTRDTAVLIGFAQDPGPTRLFRRSGNDRYRAIEPEPEYSWTMYRILIPVSKGSSDEDKHTSTLPVDGAPATTGSRSS